MRDSIKIIITDDQKLMRQGLASMLQTEDIVTVGEAENGEQLLQLLESKTLNPDIILLDLQMPEMDGNEVLKIIKIKFPEIKIIILSSFGEAALVRDFKEKGVNAYLTKNMDLITIVETIRNVHCLPGYSNIPKTIKSFFTDREIEIIPLLCYGTTTKKIGQILELSGKTVEAHRNRLYEKTGSSNVAEFTSYCAKEGLVFLG